ncbi:hypothetical protein SBA3_980022 [Candidatus Sulfopaludibacter sp. SbA3]|nr:hypothetical protein SBA3_980022 [Candidatus Sulfopaludibacter sp. SbA3]
MADGNDAAGFRKGAHSSQARRFANKRRIPCLLGRRTRATIGMKMGEIFAGSTGLRRGRSSEFSRESADEAKARAAG